MPKVNRIKLLSERTSGAPLVIFLVGFLALNVAVVVQTENNCGCVLTANKTFPPINITKTEPPLVHQS